MTYNKSIRSVYLHLKDNISSINIHGKLALIMSEDNYM